MATRTARGTAAAKASGATLTIPAVTIPAGNALIVGLGYDNAQGAPVSVTHAGRILRRKLQRNDATNGFHMSMWLKGGYNKKQTGDIVATWAAAIGKRAMYASSLNNEAFEDDASAAVQALTTSPGTGLTGALDRPNGFVFTCFVAEGPSSDHESATAEIEDGGFWTTAFIGQKAGTVGPPPISNITVIETYLEISDQDPTRARLQNATERNWVSGLVVLPARLSELRQGISISDMIDVDQIVSDAGGDPDNVYYGLNEDTGLWEAYETTTPGTLRAVRSRDSEGGWQPPV